MSDIVFPEFAPFAKMARLNRECIITEKIDGTNAQIFIDETGQHIFAGSRSRWLTPDDDNFGFAYWVETNCAELLKLGPGRHFGEWWGAGIQRKYGQTAQHFSLFNVGRWTKTGALPPTCCRVVPVMYAGPFITSAVERCVVDLRTHGSLAAEGFMQPEGIVVYHKAAGTLFKVTVERDEAPKSVNTQMTGESL